MEKNEELSLKDFILGIGAWLGYLKTKWVVITIAGIAGALAGYGYVTFKKPLYFAESTFVLEESGSPSGGLGQYAGLASMVGIDIGGSGNGIFQGDNIIELYRSKTMLRKTLLSTYEDNGHSGILIDRFMDFSGYRKKWAEKPLLKDISFKTGPGVTYTRLQDSVINEFVKDIEKDNLKVTKPDKKLSIIKVEVQAKDEVFAKSFNDNLVNNVNEFYVLTRTKKSVDNLMILKHQTDSVRNVLNNAISESAQTQDATPNLNPTRLILRAPAQRSQFNAEANKAVLAELIKNLELSNISMRKDMPLIKIVDQPIYPLENNKVKVPVAIIFGCFIALILTVGLLSLLRFYNRIMGTA